MPVGQPLDATGDMSLRLQKQELHVMEMVPVCQPWAWAWAWSCFDEADEMALVTTPPTAEARVHDAEKRGARCMSPSYIVSVDHIKLSSR
jgi:hypothetical protein